MDNYDICDFYVETDFWILIELTYCSDRWSLGSTWSIIIIGLKKWVYAVNQITL